MRSLLSFLIGIFLINYSSAQSIQLPAEKETSVKEKSKDETYTLHFKLLGRTPGTTATISLKDFDDGTANLKSDYDYTDANQLADKTITDATPQSFDVKFKVKADDEKEPTAEFFHIYLSYKAGNFSKGEKVKITIADLEKKSDIDTSKWFVKIATGSNFDFFDAPVFKNFAGELQIFAPAFVHLNPGSKYGPKLGLQAGIFTYRYFDKDSSNGNIQVEEYLRDPNVRKLVIDTTQYVRDIYALNANISYSNWGVYLNPMFNIHGNEWYDLYVDLHAEFIWRTHISSFTKATIRKDTLTFNRLDTASSRVLRAFPAIRALYNKTSYFDQYYGIGFPFKLNVKKIIDLYVKPTFGISWFNIEQTTPEINNSIVVSRSNTENKPRFFNLVKFQLTTTVAPIDIVLGGEVRKVEGQRTFKAFYLGGVVTFDKLKK